MSIKKRIKCMVCRILHKLGMMKCCKAPPLAAVKEKKAKKSPAKKAPVKKTSKKK